MKKTILLIFVALMSLFGAQAITIVPVTSTSGNETWYFIKCNPRNDADPNATWLSVTAQDSMTYTAYTGGDEQLWKVVENPNGLGGVALVNKKKGFYVDADNRRVNGLRTRITTKANMPRTPLRLVPSTGYPTQSWPGWDGKTPGIYVLDHSAATSVSADNKITVNLADSAFALSIYSPAYGTFVVANQPAWVANPNQVVLFRTPLEVALEILKDAKSLYRNSSVGPNPGQLSSDNYQALKDAIDAMEDICNSTDPTMTDLSDNIISLKATMASVKMSYNKPQISNDSEERWYFFQAGQPAAGYMTSTGDASPYSLSNKPLTLSDNQLWRIVANSDGTGYVLQNKATQEYVNTDQATSTSAQLKTTPTLPALGLKLPYLSADTTATTRRFVFDNNGSLANAGAFRLVAGGANNYYTLNDKTNTSAVNAAWILVDYAGAQRAMLKNAIVDATSVVNNIQVGSNPGEVTQSVMDELKAAIAIAQTTYDNTDLDGVAYVDASNVLLDAKVAFQGKANVPEISTETNSVWYTLSGTRPSMMSIIFNDSNDTIRYRITQQTDAELWRFVANVDGTGYVLQNKATMKYLNADLGGGKLTTQTDMPAKALKFHIISEIGFGAFRFRIENDTTGAQPISFRLHAADALPLNYTANPNDNCGWLISRADNVHTITTAITTLLPTAQTFYANTGKMESASYGGYSATARASLKVEIDKVKSLDLNSMSYEQLNQAYNTFYAAYSALMNSRISDINLLVSTAEHPKWFYWEGTRGVALNLRVASGTAGLSAVAKVDKDPAQMWRFELNEDGTVRIINYSTQNEVTGLAVQLSATAAAKQGISFSLGIHASDGVSLKITYMNSKTQWVNCHNDSGKTLWGWGGSDDNSAWRLRAIDDNTAVKNTTVNKYLIRSVNGVITIDGVSNFEVYSVMGQRINNKTSLRKGVYIVKVGNETQKYIVR